MEERPELPSRVPSTAYQTKEGDTMADHDTGAIDAGASGRRLSRRACLRLLGGGLGLASVGMLSACAPAAPPAPAAPAAPAATAAPAAQPTTAPAKPAAQP